MNAFAPVSVVPCDGYEKDTVKSALQNLLSPLGGLSAFVKPGMTVVLKANLVSGMKPEKAATTNPVLLAVLTEEIVALGAKVLLGDSPGGLYNATHVGHVYDLSGMKQVEEAGGELNRDFSQKQAEYPNAHVLKSFTYTAYLDRADLLIDVCKIKSHGMMKLSCAAKNMFGTVPGLIKPEYHYRFPDYRDFADMILDLDDYFHPALSIADGVIGMEGNGPTAGTPKRIGCLLASVSPHCLDLAASSLLGLTPSAVPTLERARAHGLIPENAGQLEVFGDLEAFRVPDFKQVTSLSSLSFTGKGNNPFLLLFGKAAGKLLQTKPVLSKNLCVGCGVCAGICPAKAIEIKEKKAVIDRQKCIRCFCCQEFCPKSAMKVRRTPVAALFHKENKKRKG